MTVIKIFIRSIIFSITFAVFSFIMDFLIHIISKQRQIDMGIEPSFMPSFTLNDFGAVFLIAFLPFLIASLSFNFFVKDRISKIFYWIVAAAPILVYLWFSTYVIAYGKIEEFLLYFFNPIFLFIAFYYNYRTIKKEFEKKNI